MGKVCVKSFVKRGQEISKKNLKDGGIYAVRYVMPAEEAAKYGTVQEQWGIVKIGADGKVILSWNVDGHNNFDSTEVHKPWVENMCYFRSSAMERQLVEYFERYIMDHVKYDKRIEEMQAKLMMIDDMHRRVMNTRAHKVAAWWIRLVEKIGL